MNDVTGRPMLAGDVVAWFRSGPTGVEGIVFGVVDSFTPGGRVRLVTEWSPTAVSAPGDRHTADRSRVVVVERAPAAELLDRWKGRA